MLIDPVALAQALIRHDTTNPPGREDPCAAHLAAVLERHGFDVGRHAFGPGRTSLVAHRRGSDDVLPPLVLTGHLDTVPFGARLWSTDPLGGEIRDGQMFGRGASDMKAGVAAAVAAAVEVAAGRMRRGIALVLTAGEETGCQGSRHLVRMGSIGRASALVIVEPTGNGLAIAHKGALHLRLRVAGRAAHGSMPDLGDNAVLRALDAVRVLHGFPFGVAADELLGLPTLAVTSIHGGKNVNSIPDACTVTVDVRTVPGMSHTDVLERLRTALDGGIEIEILADLPAVSSHPDDPFVRCVREVVKEHVGSDAARPCGMPYFTDGSILQQALDCPAVILGPGEPAQAHQTDECCDVSAIGVAATMLAEIGRRWSMAAR